MRHRQGFTLVELLVAMALIIFIMSILSGAFVAATTTFRNLKAAGDMANKLRATTQLLQRDLAADHFEGKKRLSSTTFWASGPPQQGFFRIWQGNASSVVANSASFDEGGEALAGSMHAYRTHDHALAFTIKTRGNQMGDFMSASGNVGALLANLPNNPFGPNEACYLPPVNAQTYSYQWAEVEWFMLPSINPATGQQDTTAADRLNPAAGPPLPLYTLYRRQRLAVPDNSLVTTAVPANAPNLAASLELSCWNNNGNLYFNSPIDLTVPERRFNGGAFPIPATMTLQAQGAPANLVGADIQLTDVLSFDVRISTNQVFIISTVTDFVTLFESPFPQIVNVNYFPPPGAPVGRIFDTWSSVNDSFNNSPTRPNGYSQWNLSPTAQNPRTQGTTIPMGTGHLIVALQISIRIWDQKTNQTRQVTMIQAM